MKKNRNIGTSFSCSSALGRAMQNYPLLSQERELELVAMWKSNGCRKSFDILVNSHIRLGIKIAYRHSGYGLDSEELTEEAMLGITRAAETFNPELGLRFSTYAMYWADSFVKKYIQKNGFMFSVPDAADAKRIFFRLGRMKRQYDFNGALSYEQSETIAKDLNVSLERLIEVESAMSAVGISIDKSWTEDEEGRVAEFLTDGENSPEQNAVDEDEKNYRKNLLSEAMKCLSEREHEIISARRLAESPETLEALGAIYEISKERVRQIENTAFNKITKKVAEFTKQNSPNKFERKKQAA